MIYLDDPGPGCSRAFGDVLHERACPRNDAPEPRVAETPYTSLAHHKLAGMLLWLAGQSPSAPAGDDRRIPVRQRLRPQGRVRAPHDLAELDRRLLALDVVQDERDNEWAKLHDEIAEIEELVKGGGSDEF